MERTSTTPRGGSASTRRAHDELRQAAKTSGRARERVTVRPVVCSRDAAGQRARGLSLKLRRVSALLTSLVAAVALNASALSAERQLCLLHVRASERAKLQEVLGPFSNLPLYRAEVDIDPRGRVVTGRVQLDWTVEGLPLESLPLRVVPNVFAPGRVALSGAKINGEAALIEENELGLFRLRPVSAIPVGSVARIEVSFKARVPQAPRAQPNLLSSLSGAQGSEGGDYGTFLVHPKFVSLVGIIPMVPPIDAKGELAPGPSGLGDLALYAPSNFVVSVRVPRRWQVHATGTALGEVPEKDGRLRYSFVAGAVRDFPLFASTGYATRTVKVGDVRIESVYAEEHAEAGKRVLEQTREILKAYEARLGPIPHNVLRVVEAPLLGGAGGMEFSGLVTIDTKLYGGAQNPAAMMGLPPGFEALLGTTAFGASPLGQMKDLLERTLEFTLAHELAHQYFPGIVGSDPVLAPVVDESLAQHLAVRFLAWKYGEEAAEGARQQLLVGSYQLYRLSGGADGAADRPTRDFAGPMSYAALVYGKAPFFHDAAKTLLSEPVFNASLRTYLDQYRYRWACSDCFSRLLEKENPRHGQKLRQLRQRWWDEAHGDEDLGTPNPAVLLQRMTGMQIDPAAAKLLEQLLGGQFGP